MASSSTRTLPTSESPTTTTDSRPVPDPTVLTTQQLSVAIDNVTALFNAKLEAMDKAVLLLQQMSDRRPTVGEVALKTDERFNAFDIKFDGFDKRIVSMVEEGRLRIAEVAGIHGTKIESLEKRLDHKYIETATDISHLRDVIRERIDGLENQTASQFTDRDKRAEQLALASTTAISAALQAQKEAAGETQKSSAQAIAKAETATSESVRQLQTLFQTSISGLGAQIQDVKSRLDKGEGKTSVSDPAVSDGLRALRETVSSLATSRDGGAAASTAKTAQTSFIIAVVVAGVSVIGLGMTIISRMGSPTAAVINRNADDPSKLAERNSDLIDRLEKRLNQLPK